MKQINRLLLTAVLALSAAGAVAQELRSAYFTEDFKYRHDMNPAFGNDQGYLAFPSLGNLNIGIQGTNGLGDFLYNNPRPGGKKTVTFMHPDISYNDAMKPFSGDGVKVTANVRLTLLSAGFKAFGGYNTIEINERTMMGASLPTSLLRFAKGIDNRDYSFDALSARAWSYGEIALGHSRDINEKLRVGAKLKVLLGLANANIEMENMHANLSGDTWVMEGKARGEVNIKGFYFENVEKEYKSDYDYVKNQPRPNKTYQKVDDMDIDGFGIGGFGLGIDLGAVYKFDENLTLSAALTDLGFINWSNTAVAETPGGKFEFKGFHDISVKDDHAQPGQTLDEQADNYSDQLTDFFNLEDKGNSGSRTTMLSATANIGAEYTCPYYRKLSAGLLLSHHFAGKNFSWTEGRLSVNYKPLNWLDGGVNLAVNSFTTSFGWVLNIHPKGFNFFVGMDHLITKTNQDMIPTSANANLVLGINIGIGKKAKKIKKVEEIEAVPEEITPVEEPQGTQI